MAWWRLLHAAVGAVEGVFRTFADSFAIGGTEAEEREDIERITKEVDRVVGGVCRVEKARK